MAHYVGQRLSFDAQACTVRFVGPVAGTKGEWLGVEWDDPARGKHNGSHQGVEHFKCLSKEPTAGSFLRQNRPADQPTSFLEALREKYVEPRDTATINVKPTFFNGKLAEEIGFDKIRRQLAALQELRIIILDGSRVAGIDAQPLDRKEELTDDGQSMSEEVRATCPKINQLDLSQNLLEAWIDVVAICRALPNLTSLDVSRNRFRDLATNLWTKGDAQASFQRIQELTMDSTLLSWSQIIGIVHEFPALKTLSLVSNQLLQVSNDLPSTLTNIILADNAFSSLRELSPLAELPDLESLSLRACPIRTLDMAPGIIFPRVKTLDLYETKLPADALGDLPDSFPMLESLRCSVSSESDSLLVIARIANLKILNYTSITAVQRKDAEIYYLSQIGKEVSAAPEAQQAAILSRHGRYHELCDLHGEPTVTRAAEQPSSEANKLAARFIMFSCFDHRSEPSGERTTDASKPDFKLHLPMSWNLYRVQAAVAAELQVLPLYLRLIWETDEWDPVSKERKWAKPGTVEGGLLAGEDDERSFSVSSEDEDDADADTSRAMPRKGRKWVRREVVLEPGPREVGFWIESRDANLRIETREVDVSILERHKPSKNTL